MLLRQQNKHAMHELQELAYILTKHKTRSIEIIGDETKHQNSKLHQLYKAIQKGEIKSDRQAAKYIYGESTISSKYRNLKHELKKRLLNTIFFIDMNGAKDKDDVYYQCWKEWAACRILIEKSARKTAISLAEQILKKAIKFDFYDLIVSISILLRMHYALREKNKKKFEYYDELYDFSKKQEKYRNLAHKYYMKLILDYTTDGVVANPQIEADAKEYYQALLPYMNKTKNVKFFYYLYQIQLLGKMGIFDYANAKKICDDAISFLNGKDFKGGLRNFYLNKLVCHIQLQEFKEGKVTAYKCQQLVSEGEFNWFKTNEYLFMLSFHTGNYQEGYKIYDMTIRHPRYKSHEIIHETWTLYKVYLHFLYLIEKIKINSNDKSFNSLRLGKFLNDIPSFSKDKQGMNIPVLIIQMSFLILQKNYDEAIERIESLNKYCDRYLKTNNANYRCNCFIKMLTQIPVARFNRIRIENRSSKYLDKMKGIEINYNSQAHEVEIIPFEKMWSLIIEALE